MDGTTTQLQYHANGFKITRWSSLETLSTTLCYSITCDQELSTPTRYRLITMLKQGTSCEDGGYINQ